MLFDSIIDVAKANWDDCLKRSYKVIANHELGLGKLPLEKELQEIFLEEMVKPFMEEYNSLLEERYLDKVYQAFCIKEQPNEDQSILSDVKFLTTYGDHEGVTFDPNKTPTKIEEKRKKKKERKDEKTKMENEGS